MQTQAVISTRLIEASSSPLVYRNGILCLCMSYLPILIILTRLIEASSSPPVYRNGILCLSMSEKYSLASLAVLVPNPGNLQWYGLTRHVDSITVETFTRQLCYISICCYNILIYLISQIQNLQANFPKDIYAEIISKYLSSFQCEIFLESMTL